MVAEKAIKTTSKSLSTIMETYCDLLSYIEAEPPESQIKSKGCISFFAIMTKRSKLDYSPGHMNWYFSTKHMLFNNKTNRNLGSALQFPWVSIYAILIKSIG